LENPTADTSDAIKESGYNSTEAAPLDGEIISEEIIHEHIVITVETNDGNEGVAPQDGATTEDIVGAPPEGDLTTGNGDDVNMAGSEPPSTPPEEWTIDRRTERKNKKACKNNERQQKKQAKWLQRQARLGPSWAHQGGVLPASSGSASGSPKHSSSDSNQNSQSQEIHGDGFSSNGLPGDHDPNLSGESQVGGDDETKTEASNDGNQSDFH
jgi:hypothetical protein